MPVPPLSPLQRAQALALATEARRERADIRAGLKQRRVGLAEVLDSGGTDPVVARMRVSAIIESMPGIGPATAGRIMQELGITSSRRVRGLGRHQRTALLERFSRA